MHKSNKSAVYTIYGKQFAHALLMKRAIKIQQYRSDRESGVVAYSLEKKGIVIIFREGWYYLYDYDRPGIKHVKNMVGLAKMGAGLSIYINQHVRENFQRKWRED